MPRRRFAALLFAIVAAGCASRPSDATRTVAAGDRVRVWLEPGASASPIVGQVDSIGRDALALDGSWVERRRVMAVQVGDRGYRTWTRAVACVLGTGTTVIAGSIGDEDLLSFIFAESAAGIGGALARPCLFPPDYWIEGQLPGQPRFEVVGPMGHDPRPATPWGSVCEHALMFGLPIATLVIGIEQDASDTGMVLALLGTNALSGWLQEKACPRIDPGELWLGPP